MASSTHALVRTSKRTPLLYSLGEPRTLLSVLLTGLAVTLSLIALFPLFWVLWMLLARGAAMRFLLTRLVDWLNVPAGALVQPKNPLEYFRKLRFHQKAESVRDYGLADKKSAIEQL